MMVIPPLALQENEEKIAYEWQWWRPAGNQWLAGMKERQAEGKDRKNEFLELITTSVFRIQIQVFRIQ